MTDSQAPIYEYVKGQGWVPGPSCQYYVGTKIYKGKTYRVTIMLRYPKLGERAWSLYNRQSFDNILFELGWRGDPDTGGFGWVLDIDKGFPEEWSWDYRPHATILTELVND
jgi:hypothetical protein